MSDDSFDVTNAEFAVLEALWAGSRQTIRELTARLYPSGSVSDYATVQKLLERLEAKGCVRRDRSAHRHVFKALVDRDRFIGGQLQRMADKLCDGSLTPVLLHLVENTKLSKRDREALRRMLDEAESRKSQAIRRRP